MMLQVIACLSVTRIASKCLLNSGKICKGLKHERSSFTSKFKGYITEFYGIKVKGQIVWV